MYLLLNAVDAIADMYQRYPANTVIILLVFACIVVSVVLDITGTIDSCIVPLVLGLVVIGTAFLEMPAKDLWNAKQARKELDVVEQQWRAGDITEEQLNYELERIRARVN